MGICSMISALNNGFFFTIFILKVINRLIPVKASLKEERDGLDFSYHGEVARDIA